MSYFDSRIMISVGTLRLLLLETIDRKPVYIIIGAVAELSTMALIIAYVVYHKRKKHTNSVYYLYSNCVNIEKVNR